jgi:MerR family transcriptional regulator, redox-sensitive transcriptional activator SoxR
MMKISDAAKRAGVLATTIRYYESIGLLPPAHRINGHRVYGPEILDRLAVIRFGLNTGFSLAELKALFLGIESRTTRRSAAQDKLKELRQLRDRLSLMEKLLKEIRLCRCGTLQQIAERLMQSGALAFATRGGVEMFNRRLRSSPIGIVEKYR